MYFSSLDYYRKEIHTFFCFEGGNLNLLVCKHNYFLKTHMRNIMWIIKSGSFNSLLWHLILFFKYNKDILTCSYPFWKCIHIPLLSVCNFSNMIPSLPCIIKMIIETVLLWNIILETFRSLSPFKPLKQPDLCQSNHKYNLLR